MTYGTIEERKHYHIFCLRGDFTFRAKAQNQAKTKASFLGGAILNTRIRAAFKVGGRRGIDAAADAATRRTASTG